MDSTERLHECGRTAPHGSRPWLFADGVLVTSFLGIPRMAQRIKSPESCGSCTPRVPTIHRIRAKFGSNGAEFDQIRQSVANIGRAWPTWARLGQTLPKLGQFWPTSSEPWADSAHVGECWRVATTHANGPLQATPAMRLPGGVAERMANSVYDTRRQHEERGASDDIVRQSLQCKAELFPKKRFIGRIGKQMAGIGTFRPGLGRI